MIIPFCAILIPISQKGIVSTSLNKYQHYIVICYSQFVVVILFLRLQTGAKKAYRKFKHVKATTVDQRCRPITYRCCLCGVSSNSFQLLPSELEQEREKPDVNYSNLSLPDEVKLATNLVLLLFSH